MSVTATEWLSKSLLATEDLLVACPQFLTLLGAGNAAAARSKTYWHDYRGTTSAPLAVLTLGPGTDGETNALNVRTHVDSVMLEMVIDDLTSTGDTQKDKATRMLNACGQLLAEVASGVQSGSYLSSAQRSFEGPYRFPDNSAYAGKWYFAITFSWEI